MRPSALWRKQQRRLKRFSTVRLACTSMASPLTTSTLARDRHSRSSTAASACCTEAAAALGREIETPGGLRTYRENIRKHFRTSIAAAEGAVGLRREYLEYQKDFYNSAVADAARSSTKAYIVAAPEDPARVHLFADLLNYHRIETYRPARDVTIGGTTFSRSNAMVIPTGPAAIRVDSQPVRNVDGIRRRHVL